MKELISKTELIMIELYYMAWDAPDIDTAGGFKGLADLVKIYLVELNEEYCRLN